MRTVFFVLMMAAILLGQTTKENYPIQGENPINWGAKIRLGTTFTSTDSTALFKYNVDDSLYPGAQDTLFSDALPITGPFTEGIWTVVGLDVDLGSGSHDSVYVDVRFCDDFWYTTDAAGIVHDIDWDATWHRVMTLDAGVKNKLSISQADSSWHQQAYMRQYRVRIGDAVADTSRVKLTDYLR
jgi:hypothetical protein